MTNDLYNSSADQLAGQGLDFWMYRHAAQQLGKETSQSEFEKGYANKMFHFCNDKALLADLIEQYDIRLQKLGDEWLASTENASQFGTYPGEAVCRLVVTQAFGTNPSL